MLTEHDVHEVHDFPADGEGSALATVIAIVSVILLVLFFNSLLFF